VHGQGPRQHALSFGGVRSDDALAYLHFKTNIPMKTKKKRESRIKKRKQQSK
jgi:hypothetical protein